MSHTVVVIGFYGSKPRHVEKYAAIWKDMVPGVKRVVANDCSGTLSLLTLGSHRDAKNIVSQIKDESHVIFHVLSNRGMWVYLEVARMLPSNVKIDGVVFDSCEFTSFGIWRNNLQTNRLTTRSRGAKALAVL